MGTYFKIAWRNILRNRWRSGIIIAAIAISLGVLIFIRGLQDGSHQQMIDNMTALFMGHLQIHREGFAKQMSITRLVGDPAMVRRALERHEGLTFAERVAFPALISSGDHSSAAVLAGIDPEREGALSTLGTKVVKGEYLVARDEKVLHPMETLNDEGEVVVVPVEAHPIVLGWDVAQNLEVEVGDKVVFLTQTAQGTTDGVACRVKGVFRTGSSEMDKAFGLVPLDLAQDLLLLGNRVTTFVARVEPYERLDEVTAALRRRLEPEGLEVLRWFDAEPMMQELLEMDDVSMYIIVTFVLIIVGAAILNVILMSFLERTKEFGVMMALGTKGRQLSLLVAIESVLLAAMGILAGTALGGVLIWIGYSEGIDLSRYSTALEDFYLDPVIHPIFRVDKIAEIVLGVIIVTLLASLYPAWRASRLQPVEAIRGG